MPTHAPLRREVGAVADVARVTQAEVGIPDVLGDVAYVRRMHIGKAGTAMAGFRASTALAALPFAEALRARGQGVLLEVCAKMLRKGSKVER
jgi:hypothetical protein